MTPSISLLLDDVVRVHAQGQMLLLRTGDIVAVRSQENYSVIHFAGETTTTVRIPLKIWAEQLPAALFVRTHRTTLVNREHVLRFEVVGPKKWLLHLRGHARPLPVGRLYCRALKAALPAVASRRMRREFAGAV